MGKHSRLNNIYSGIKARCYNSNLWNYQYYGARGIKMCDEWKNNYQTFKKWALENGYQDNLSIDRIDTNGNYEPNNCRWVTDKEQKNNTRRNHYITYNGKTQSMSKWAEELNISYTVLRSRINRLNWSVEKAFTTPVYDISTTNKIKNKTYKFIRNEKGQFIKVIIDTGGME